MLERPGYERFGLIANPFQDLASETAEEAALLQVDQEFDGALTNLKEEVLEGHRKAVVALIGPLGVGKTQRLNVARDEAQHVGIFHAYHQLSVEARFAISGLAGSVRQALKEQGFAKGFVTPAWYRDLQALEKGARKSVDPEAAGKTIATALNQVSPCFLLLNDLHHLEMHKESDRFVQTLHTISNCIRPGVLVMLSCYPDYFARLMKRHPQFTTRIDRRVRIEPLGDEQAAHLIAKRLPAKRLIDDLDPVYPFDREAIAAMNHAVHGNPRKLLRLADRVLERAAQGRAFHIGADDVAAVLPASAAPPVLRPRQAAPTVRMRPLPERALITDDDPDAPPAPST